MKTTTTTTERYDATGTLIEKTVVTVVENDVPSVYPATPWTPYYPTQPGVWYSVSQGSHTSTASNVVKFRPPEDPPDSAIPAVV